jgi:hypothetical protein
MKHLRFLFSSFCAALCTAALFSHCGSTTAIVSAPAQSAITIDGNDADWLGQKPVILADGVSINVRNDEKFLYVLLKAVNRPQQMLLMLGRVVAWFDAAGGTDKRFGIRFPLPRPRPEMERRSDDDAPPDFLAMADQNEFELLEGEGLEGARIPLFGAKGLALKVANTQGTLIYEMQIPLRDDKEFSYGIGAKGSTIGIGFETTKLERRAPGERMNADRTARGGMDGYPDGREGGGMTGGGMPGGGMRGGRGQRVDGVASKEPAINEWLKVTLAK